MPFDGGTSSNGSTPAERASFLDQWLKRRIAEANEIEAKIQNRISYLEKTESGLRALHEAVKKQVIEALPLLDGINKFKKEEGKVLDELVAAKAALEGVFDQQIDQAKTALGRLGELCGESVDEAAKRLQTCNDGMRAIGDVVESKIRKGMDEIYDHAKQAVDPMIERLCQDVERAKARAEHLRQSAEHAVEGHLGTFEANLASRTEALRVRMENQAEQSLRSAETAMRQELLRLSEDFARSGEGIKSEMARLAVDLKNAIFRETSQSGEMLQRQVGQWIEASEKRVDESAMEMGNRILKVEQRAHEAFESARLSLEQRMNRMEQDLESRLGWIAKRVDLRLSEMVERTSRAPKTGVEVRVFAAEEKSSKVA